MLSITASLLVLVTSSSLAFAKTSSSAAPAATNPCGSFGIDYQDGGSYFINNQSTQAFTFVETFEGCQNDTAQNILVDPSGNQYQCSDTPMMPANTSEMSTCPLDKNQMVTGEWSIIIMSNNGDGQPIAYERDFSVTVGVPSTVTATPTITANITTTPIQNVTLWVTATNMTTLTPQTYTAPSVTITPTKTVIPKPIVTTVMKTLTTVQMTIPMVTATTVIKTVMATCTVPIRQPTCDGDARIEPTVSRARALASSASITIFSGPRPSIMPVNNVQVNGNPAGNTPAGNMPVGNVPAGSVPVGGKTGSGSSPVVGSGSVGAATNANPKANTNGNSGWGPFAGWSGMSSRQAPSFPGYSSSAWGTSGYSFGGRSGGWKSRKARRDIEEFIARRHERFAGYQLRKRAPDQAVITVTDSNTADWATTTKTWVMPTQTLTVTSTTYVMSTVTPAPVGVMNGQTTAAQMTQTMPASTRTVQKFTVGYNVITHMQTYTMTLTTTMTPAAQMTACQRLGGWLHNGW